MVRFIHVSDTHLGYRSGNAITESGGNLRKHDFYNAWMDACTKIRDLNPDFIIHSGDVFDIPKPPFEAIKVFIEGLNLIRPIPFVMIAGNHETSSYRSDISVLDAISVGMENVVSITGWDERIVEICGVPIYGLPHGRLMLPKEFDPPSEGIMVGHGDTPVITFANYEPGRGMVPISLLDHPWSYVAMGHIHQAQTAWKANAWYAGSTERSGWSDATASPGFYEVELTSGKKPKLMKVKVAHREFVDLGVISIPDVTGAVLELEHRLIGKNHQAVIRVSLELLSRSEKRIFEHTVRNKMCLKSLQINHSVEEKTVGEALHTPDLRKLSVMEMFKEFIAQRDFEPEFRSRFEAMGSKALEAAELEEAERATSS